MRSIRKWALLCMGALLAALLLAGCDNSALYDDEKAIAADADRYSVVSYQGSMVQDGGYELTAGSITGIRKVWELNASEDTGEVELSYTLAVSKGKAKLVLVQADGVLETLAELAAGEEAADTYRYTPEKGRNRLKLVAAEDAAIEASFGSEQGSWGSD